MAYTPPTPYERVLAKYYWAQKRVDEFDVAAEIFRKSNPHSFGKHHDLEAGHFVYYAKTVGVIPNHLPLMLGDAIHNLRSTLDHLARALVIASCGTPHNHTSFPICDTAEAYPGFSRSKLPGLGKMCYEVLDRVQPYKGGWGHNLWQLHHLDIVDKHRLLLAIASVPAVRSLAPGEAAFIAGRSQPVASMANYLGAIMTGTNPQIVKLEAGHEFARFPALEEYENVGFAFDISINDTDITEGMPVFLMLRHFTSEVGNVIDRFAPYL